MRIDSDCQAALITKILALLFFSGMARLASIPIGKASVRGKRTHPHCFVKVWCGGKETTFV